MIVVGRPGTHNHNDLVTGASARDERRKRENDTKGKRRRVKEKKVPTPADEYVPPEVFLLEDKGERQQRLQVHALHQQPEVVGQDAELEEGHYGFTGRLRDKQGTKDTSVRWICGAQLCVDWL